jgi:hypothetical protein
MRRVAFYRTKFLFSFPMLYQFPTPFLSLGARAPPFSNPYDRLYCEPIVVHDSLSTIANLRIYTNISYVIGRFYNLMTLWHVLFDFIVPAYYTIMRFETKFENPERRVFLHDSEYDVFNEVVSLLSDSPVTNIKSDGTPRFFSRVVVGLPKFERINLRQDARDLTKFRYNFPSGIANGLREVVMSKLSVDPPEDAAPPRVVIASRQGDHRDIMNSNEIYKHIVHNCPFCVVDSVVFHRMTFREQVQLVSSASVLIGLHGSALSHVLWLPRGRAALVEILPFKYSCRDWYQVTAGAPGVAYFSVMNRGRLLPVVEPGRARLAKKCWTRPDLCGDLCCNDLLKDQKFELELEVLNETWQQVLAILEHNRQGRTAVQ